MTEPKTTAPQHYAELDDPLIQAILHELFRFTVLEQAKKRLESLKDHFLISKHQIDGNGHPSILMWIKGYEITPEQDEEGYFGNYALVSYKRIEKGRYALFAQKIEAELKRHPQRKLIKRGNPNWGHPVLRKLKDKKKTFASTAEAHVFLMQLHEDFPHATIPNPTKLFTIIYSRDTKPPTKKYVFEIKTNAAGAAWIDWTENMQKPAKSKPLPVSTALNANPKTPTPGKFTTMVEERRAKKKRK